MILALEHKIPEYIPNYRTEILTFIPSCIHERAPGDGSPEQSLGGTGKDWFGVEWVFEKTSSASMVSPYVPPLLEDINDWKDVVVFPDLDAIDWDAARAKDERMIDRNKFMAVTLLNGPFERLHSLMGMINANCSLLTDPEACGEFFDAVADFKIRLIDKIFEYYPVDAIDFHDDWGHQTNTFMSPETWRNLIAPAIRKIVVHVREKGKFLINHSCGKVEALIPHMIDIGIDHWSSCQSCNDIDGIIRRFGDRLTLFGGMDVPELTEPSISSEELKERVSRRIDNLCRGGALLPFGSRNYPELVRTINQVILEKRDFFKQLENTKLPAG
jgi:hypothetical protein